LRRRRRRRRRRRKRRSELSQTQFVGVAAGSAIRGSKIGMKYGVRKCDTYIDRYLFHRGGKREKKISAV
jgi:hypothetical protein